MLQGLLTVLAAIIASVTALYVAKRVYPEQKRIDHANDMLKEKREAYRKFLGGMNAVFTAIVQTDFEKAKLNTHELHALGSDFLCFASPEVAASARHYLDCMQDYRQKRFKKVNGSLVSWKDEGVQQAKKATERARANTISAIRSDLLGFENSGNDQAVSAFFPNSYEGDIK
ncbi:hypothetical protein SAMN06265173_106154 [Thalassovita litoralis]|uniref:Uncharacterized protein n=1 Tax=Thalassovita litoralis TaxID=1010611 RepID=A0A521CH18_9RHOB|nr:hypothetical protein [Thalassovita litoralis]SMO58728.1 hypothetical protein SAMN06265173_106154 [Thalassovita litoralis]